MAELLSGRYYAQPHAPLYSDRHLGQYHLNTVGTGLALSLRYEVIRYGGSPYLSVLGRLRCRCESTSPRHFTQLEFLLFAGKAAHYEEECSNDHKGDRYHQPGSLLPLLTYILWLIYNLNTLAYCV